MGTVLPSDSITSVGENTDPMPYQPAPSQRQPPSSGYLSGMGSVASSSAVPSQFSATPPAMTRAHSRAPSAALQGYQSHSGNGAPTTVISASSRASSSATGMNSIALSSATSSQQTARPEGPLPFRPAPSRAPGPGPQGDWSQPGSVQQFPFTSPSAAGAGSIASSTQTARPGGPMYPSCAGPPMANQTQPRTSVSGSQAIGVSPGGARQSSVGFPSAVQSGVISQPIQNPSQLPYLPNARQWTGRREEDPSAAVYQQYLDDQAWKGKLAYQQRSDGGETFNESHRGTASSDSYASDDEENESRGGNRSRHASRHSGRSKYDRHRPLASVDEEGSRRGDQGGVVAKRRVTTEKYTVERTIEEQYVAQPSHNSEPFQRSRSKIDDYPGSERLNALCQKRRDHEADKDREARENLRKQRKHLRDIQQGR